MRRALLTLSLLAVGACDVVDEVLPDTLTIDGVTVTRLGDASLRLDPISGELTVTNIGASGNDGIRVDQAFTSGELYLRPVDIPTGGRFGFEARDASGAPLAGIFSEDDGSGEAHDIRFSFGNATGVTAVQIRYLLQGQVVGLIPRLSLGSGRSRAEGTGGKGEGEPTSVHTIRDRGRYVVVTDYDEPDGARHARGGCAGALVTPPVDIDGLPTGLLCTDYVEITPLDGTFPDAVSGVDVTGRLLGSFTITDVDVD